MRDLRRRDPRVCYVSLARNFGHQIAVTAGLRFAQRDTVMIMDADLQDPPELVPQLVEKWREGYAVVYARRTARPREGILKRWLGEHHPRHENHVSSKERPVSPV
jgi:dolichol-phosphate mannosyltransferase